LRVQRPVRVTSASSRTFPDAATPPIGGMLKKVDFAIQSAPLPIFFSPRSRKERSSANSTCSWFGGALGDDAEREIGRRLRRVARDRDARRDEIGAVRKRIGERRGDHSGIVPWKGAGFSFGLAR
jgi:hypothetical protein